MLGRASTTIYGSSHPARARQPPEYGSRRQCHTTEHNQCEYQRSESTVSLADVDDLRFAFVDLCTEGEHIDRSCDETNEHVSTVAVHDWCPGHHHVDRPPIVACCMIPQPFGHEAPATRCGNESPMLDPPRTLRSATVEQIVDARLDISGPVKESARRCGARPARHKTSSTKRLPNPATHDWSRSNDLMARRRRSHKAVSSVIPIVDASMPRRDISGSSSTDPSRRWSRTVTTESPMVNVNRFHAGFWQEEAYSNCWIGPCPSMNNIPVIPKRRPNIPSSISSSRSFPCLLVAVNA